ncbi:MAG TPA: hypothetical protein VHN55_06230 [Sphingomicrobium sp.]|nr:hypothetical protein [Sphingomicrobium sp.]
MRSYPLLALAFIASPALAHHPGPAGVGSGSGLTVHGTDTLAKGQGAAGLRFLFTRPDRRSDEELAGLAGMHVHAHDSDYDLNVSLGFAYGITDRLTVSAELPYVRRDDLRAGEHSHSGGASHNSVEQLGTVAGFGDASILAKYRLTGNEGVRLALFGGVKLPTGGTHRTSDDGERLETEHQPGTGSWDPMVGGSAAVTKGALQVTASALYQFSTKGAQRTRLGDRLQGGIAFCLRFGPGEDHHEAEEHHHDAGDEHHQHEVTEHGHQSWDAILEVAGEWEGRQRISGVIENESGGAWVYAAPGVRFNSANGWSAAAAVAIPLWQNIRQSHPDNSYRLIVSLGRSF